MVGRIDVHRAAEVLTLSVAMLLKSDQRNWVGGEGNDLNKEVSQAHCKLKPARV